MLKRFSAKDAKKFFIHGDVDDCMLCALDEDGAVWYLDITNLRWYYGWISLTAMMS